MILNQNRDDVTRLFRGFNCSDDTIYDAMNVACEMFDPDYEPLDEDERGYLYF